MRRLYRGSCLCSPGGDNRRRPDCPSPLIDCHLCATATVSRLPRKVKTFQTVRAALRRSSGGGRTVLNKDERIGRFRGRSAAGLSAAVRCFLCKMRRINDFGGLAKSGPFDKVWCFLRLFSALDTVSCAV